MEMDWQPLKDRIARDGLKKGRNEWRAGERAKTGGREKREQHLGLLSP